MGDGNISGKGIATQARDGAIFRLQLPGALDCATAYDADNTASRRVSDKLGYLDDGVTHYSYEGVRHTRCRRVLPVRVWEEVKPEWVKEVEVFGWDNVKSFFFPEGQ